MGRIVCIDKETRKTSHGLFKNITLCRVIQIPESVKSCRWYPEFRIPPAAPFFLLGIQAFLSTCNQAFITIKMAVQRKFVDKGLLKNVIRHTDASNKVSVYFCHIFIEFRSVLNIVLRKLLNHLARAQKKTGGSRASCHTQPKFVFAGYLAWDSLLKLWLTALELNSMTLYRWIQLINRAALKCNNRWKSLNKIRIAHLCVF